MKKTILISTCLLVLGTALTAQNKYSVSGKIKLEGDGGWDYLAADEAGDRLFISHGSMVQVVDTKENKLGGTIPDTKGVHGIALAHDLNKGFVSNGRDSSVTVFDLKTLAVTAKVKVTGANPDAILYDPFSKKVFVYNGRSNNATVLDAKTNKVLATIPLQGKPEFSVTDLKGHVYVNIEDKNLVTMINPTTMKAEQSWPIEKGDEPSGLALDNNTHRLFIVCGDKVMVIMNALDGKVVASVQIGDHCDGVAFDPELKCAYSSNGEGTVTVVKEEDENTFKVIETIETQKGARTIAVNSKTHHLYLPTAEYGEAPAVTKENPRPRPAINPGTFTILEIIPAK